MQYSPIPYKTRKMKLSKKLNLRNIESFYYSIRVKLTKFIEAVINFCVPPSFLHIIRDY